MKPITRRVLIIGLAGLAGCCAAVWFCNAWVISATRARVYEDPSAVPARDVALVLGARRTTPDGHWANPHFANRIEAAAELYRTGKVKHLLVSGDNHVRGYDEPSDMRDALVAAGVPAEAVVLDYAGFRTLDSVVRAKEVFGQTRLMVVSERFHNYRALFICRHYGIDAVAYDARPVSLRVSTWPAFREWLARVKVVLDLYVLRTRPKFLGTPVQIWTDRGFYGVG
ncbi:MAG TPA: ElyC/SanA/YdcF family protein [Verrucomicrobiae bacterium]|nr:ElyC/SanA/YdcF family protein [Verrucomicrobiae bacterium]